MTMKLSFVQQLRGTDLRAVLGQLLKTKRSVIKLVELFVFALTAPFLGSLLFSSDPLGINAGFPWAAAVPIVFAARYGSLWGFSCSLVSALAFMSLSAAYAGQQTALIALALGTVALCVLVGDAASSWRQRSQQADAENQYLRHRLKEFSNDYHVLKVSHGQLEEFMAGQRMSLRQALQQLKPVFSYNNEGIEAGAELMAIFAQFCSVQVAGLYAMRNETQIDGRPVATHGNMGDLPVFDRLLRLAVEEKQLVSVKLESHATDHHEGGLLAVVPIVDSQQQLHGVLAVRDMHFMAFQQENLNILALLGGYVGDMLARSRGLANSRTAWFLAELDTALRFASSHNVQSSLLCLQFERAEYVEEVATMVSTNIRSLDSSWMPETKNGRTTVVILLPLISEKDCNAYLRRIGSSVRDEFSLELQDLLYDVDTKQITSNDNRETCLNFINNSTGFVAQQKTDETASKIRLKRVA